MSNIKNFFERFDLEPADVEAIHTIATPRNYDAGALFIDIGSNRKKVGIIEKGLARSYRIKPSGEEISLDFAKEGEVASTQDLILYHTESSQIVEFLEPSTALVFNYRDLVRLAQDYPRIERLRNQFLQDYLVKISRRLETFLVGTANDRYEWLAQEQPELLQRVPQKHLASYLGITPVSLSRLLARRNKK